MRMFMDIYVFVAWMWWIAGVGEINMDVYG